MTRWRAIACDYDRTLTDEHLRPDAHALAALGQARDEGIRVIAVTGRPLHFVRRTLPTIDAVVAENGAVRWYEGSAEVWEDWPDRPRVLDALDAAKIPFEAHEVMLSLPRSHAVAAKRALREHALRATFQVNVNSCMLLPRGVDKGTGLLLALAGLGVGPLACAAIGDGENDVAMFRVAGLGAAPAHGTREAREAADLELRSSWGAAVAELVAILVDENRRNDRLTLD